MQRKGIFFVTALVLISQSSGQVRKTRRATNRISSIKLLEESARVAVARSCSIIEEYDSQTDSCYSITSLAVESIIVQPDSVTNIVVLGAINGESTYGVTIMLEIIAREGNQGTVSFTSTTDIIQIGDPWPDIGIFSSYDTDLSGADFLNGSVDDDENYLPFPTSYSGLLSQFPIEISSDAVGTWDIVLDTSEGISEWEAVPTILVSGTVTVE